MGTNILHVHLVAGCDIIEDVDDALAPVPGPKSKGAIEVQQDLSHA
jgi:hypothetical protein